MSAKKMLPREADGTVNIQAARKQMRGHRTNEEIERKAAGEVKAEPPKRILAPKYLPENLRGEFRELAKQLIACGIFSALDYDMLARYLIARSAWLAAQSHANAALKAADKSATLAWGKAANMYFGQCQSCAAVLGLSITSRCRLVVPKPPEDAASEDPMSRMLRERVERRRQA